MKPNMASNLTVDDAKLISTKLDSVIMYLRHDVSKSLTNPATSRGSSIRPPELGPRLALAEGKGRMKGVGWVRIPLSIYESN